MKLKKRLFIPLSLILVCTILIFEISPLVENSKGIQPQQVRQAKQRIKLFADGLAADTTTVRLTISPEQASAIGAAVSSIIPKTATDFGFSPTAIETYTSTILIPRWLFLNTTCYIELHQTSSNVSHCFVGDLPLPGALVSALSYGVTSLLFDSEVAKTIDNILSGWTLKQGSLHLIASKPRDFKQRINKSLDSAKQVARVAISQSIPSPDKIQAYIDSLENQNFSSMSLALPIKHLSLQATVESLDSDPVEENKAFIWALAVKYAGSRFAKLAGVTPVTVEPYQLRDRRDLALHFIYSAILQQIGDNQVSFAIGELKELDDTNVGGSGFSFADLAADKAGTLFADTLTKSTKSALVSQNLLNLISDERTFMPFVHDLPEGLHQRDFEQLFRHTQSDTYLQYERSILDRVTQLTLHSTKLGKRMPTSIYSQVAPVTNGQWYTIDTHIHSKYSDGAHSIDEIAKKSIEHGCDVIAITDHGDKNLTRVLSDAWFNDVSAANRKYQQLTVIPGLEWNIPPFNGREHATVLFPNSKGTQQRLREFRNNFDHYGEINQRLLSSSDAFEWMNNQSWGASRQPVIIYNHPSRKDNNASENHFDLSNWMHQSKAVIGMSAAPGHQKKRGLYNGSYEKILRTIHGFDPVSGVIGGEWDKLLQDGKRVLSARAASDFHNTSMDYWPCEFSSTHVYAASPSQNDILNALHAGRTWAQHGKFIQALEFKIMTLSDTFYAGDIAHSATLTQDETASIEIRLTLNHADWQALPTSIDELQLVVIFDDFVKPINLIPLLRSASDTSPQTRSSSSKKIFYVNLPLGNMAGANAIRLQGRSMQPELHHYQFVSNPIFIVRNTK